MAVASHYDIITTRLKLTQRAHDVLFIVNIDLAAAVHFLPSLSGRDGKIVAAFCFCPRLLVYVLCSWSFPHQLSICHEIVACATRVNESVTRHEAHIAQLSNDIVGDNVQHNRF